jgi:8-oxo-dGTP pyrophosphatase MutT (NUDIX family)
MSETQKTIICRDIYGNPNEVDVSTLSFRPSVYGLTIRDGKILLSRVRDGYDFPGGGIDIDEKIPDALKREVLEETGVSVQVGELLLVAEDFFTHPVTKKSSHSILMFYTCTDPVGEISTDMFHASDHALGTQKAEWVDIEQAVKLKYYNPIDSEALIRKAAALIGS